MYATINIEPLCKKNAVIVTQHLFNTAVKETLLQQSVKPLKNIDDRDFWLWPQIEFCAASVQPSVSPFIVMLPGPSEKDTSRLPQILYAVSMYVCWYSMAMGYL